MKKLFSYHPLQTRLQNPVISLSHQQNRFFSQTRTTSFRPSSNEDYEYPELERDRDDVIHYDHHPIWIPSNFDQHISFRQSLKATIEGENVKELQLDDREWVKMAVERLNSDLVRSSDTHLIKLQNLILLESRDIHFYLKDESTHPTGSLKHRLARSLFMYGLCNGWIHKNTTIIEASSGSTAVSEAYFASLLGLKFIAVVPESTSKSKIDLIQFFHGDIHYVDKPSEVYKVSQELEKETKGHFMNQFKYAERATDWHGYNNIASSLFRQMERERYPIPEWIVCGAGTGGTSATLSRYTRFKSFETKLCVADPDNSVFYEYWKTGNKELTSSIGSQIEGIGRPRVEESFVRESVDRMLYVPDNYSVAAMRVLESILGKKVGPSTGTNFYAMLLLASEMISKGKGGSITGILCDSGERYNNTYFNDEWLAKNNFEIREANAHIEAYLRNEIPLPVFER